MFPLRGMPVTMHTHEITPLAFDVKLSHGVPEPRGVISPSTRHGLLFQRSDHWQGSPGVRVGLEHSALPALCIRRHPRRAATVVASPPVGQQDLHHLRPAVLGSQRKQSHPSSIPHFASGPRPLSRSISVVREFEELLLESVSIAGDSLLDQLIPDYCARDVISFCRGCQPLLRPCSHLIFTLFTQASRDFWIPSV